MIIDIPQFAENSQNTSYLHFLLFSSVSPQTLVPSRTSRMFEFQI